VTVSSLEPGVVLGRRYEISRVLGSGGMGMVFQAHDRDLDEPVALKVLRPEIARMDPSILERFKTEIRVARRIAHRNVVRTFDFGDADGIKFISMEFIQGMTLKQLIRGKGALPLNVGLSIAKQACAGLVAAHDLGVVHRDVKPHNIMLTPQSEVKIMDFGIVRDEKRESGMTQTGLIMGTPDYMSPEQAQGKGDLDQRSDVYSFGVVLYEMFTGALPFRGETPIAVAMKHVQERPKAPRAVNPDVPAELEKIILRAMEKAPAARYPRMADLQVELHRFSKAAVASKS
jgi:serine/threonine-protein kinase